MNLMNYPFVVAGLSFALLWLSALIGASFRRRRKLREDDREDFNLVIAATLTLLGLIIGFSFSMAVSRYDLRKTTRKQRPTQSARSTCGQIYSLPPMRREFACCCASTSMSV